MRAGACVPGRARQAGGGARQEERGRGRPVVRVAWDAVGVGEAVEAWRSPLMLTRRGLVLTASAATLSLSLSPTAHAFLTGGQDVRNRYILIRHGESWASETRKDRIISNPGLKYDQQWGITETGREQMVRAGRRLEEELGIVPEWVYTSNFSRAFQSAVVLRATMVLPWAQLRLLEGPNLIDPRYMGSYDETLAVQSGPGALRGQQLREIVWENDLLDYDFKPPPSQAGPAGEKNPGISTESTKDLYRRGLEVISRFEQSYPNGTDIAIVGHQDPLSVLGALLAGTDPRRHHLDHRLDYGEARLYAPDRLSLWDFS